MTIFHRAARNVGFIARGNATAINRAGGSAQMRSWIGPMDHALHAAGGQVAVLWFLTLRLFVLLSFPAGGIAGSLVIGYLVAQEVGGGALTWLPAAFVVYLFLSAYVWRPHLRLAARRLADRIGDPKHPAS